MPLDILEEVVLQVLKKVSVEDGDILVVRCNPDSLSDIAEIMQGILMSKRVMLVHEDKIDFLGEVDETTMNNMGWYKRADTSR